MHSNCLFAPISPIFCSILQELSIYYYNKRSDKFGERFSFGIGCTGTPSCGTHKCGNVDDMCYCDCDVQMKFKTTDLGYKCNDGLKMVNYSYALNGTKSEIDINFV